MQQISSIGSPGWTREEILGSIGAFTEIYRRRPIQDNYFGMGAPHMFATWFITRQIKPACIVESGVWKGQSTWLLEQAAPDAALHCIEINPSAIQYRSPCATYHNKDFSTIDWSDLPAEKTLLFFDDHQNAMKRVRLAKVYGFKHLLFDDNYPAGKGDCYSLRKALAGAGFAPEKVFFGLRDRLSKSLHRIFTGRWPGYVPRGTTDRMFLQRSLKIYYEFPPVFMTEYTRWGDPWNRTAYPGPEPLFDQSAWEQPGLDMYWREAQTYNWPCYVELL